MICQVICLGSTSQRAEACNCGHDLLVDVPSPSAAQDIQAEVQAILNGKPTSSMEQESDNGQHAVVVHGTSAAKVWTWE